jgi:CBS domain containing-hemolysin-like protein
MISTEVLPLVSAAGFVLLAGLFGCLEAALARVSRVRVEELVRDGRPGALRLQKVLSDPPRSLNLLLLLRVLCELAAAGIVVAYCMDRIAGSAAVVLAVGVMTVVSYVFVGVAPRTIGRQQAEGVALAGSGIALALTRVFGPLPTLLILVGNALTPGKGFRDGPFASEAELRDLVELAQEGGVVERSERDMINSVFELGDTLVREVMVPRPDIVMIERGKTVRQALNLALRSGFSRIPVVGENADDVLGVAYLKDLVRRERAEGGGSLKVEDAMREPVFVPDSKPVDELLARCRPSSGTSPSWSTSTAAPPGLVTIEDVLEEIVGEITDEYDREAPPGRGAGRAHPPGHRAAARRGPRGALRRGPAARRRGDGRRPDGGAAGPRPDPGGDGPDRRPAAGGRERQGAPQPDRHGPRHPRPARRPGGAAR